MNSKQRINAVLKGELPDRTPYFDFIMSQRFVEAVMGHKPSIYNADVIVPCVRKACIDVAWIPVKGFMGIENEVSLDGYSKDEWGVKYRRVDSSWPVNAPVNQVIIDENSLNEYKFPTPEKSAIEDVNRALDLSEGEVAVFAGIPGPLRAAWFLMGFENISLCLYDCPQVLEKVFEGAVNYFENIIDYLSCSGVDAIVMSEDMGFTTSSYFSPKVFREHIFPWQVRINEHCIKTGIPLILHSDGNLNSILDDLMKMDFSGYHPFERKANMDIFDTRMRYPDKLLIGNIDSKSTLPEGNMHEIKLQATELIEAIGKEGRYILASDHSINDTIEPKTIFDLIEFVKNHKG